MLVTSLYKYSAGLFTCKRLILPNTSETAVARGMIVIAEDDNLRKWYIQLTQNGHFIEVQYKQSLHKLNIY